MSILFGHPSGGPFSHHAALAHFEAGRLEAFCVAWMPSSATLRALGAIGPLRELTLRLSRRHFEPLVGAPLIQGRIGELRRLFIRALGRGDERLSYEASDWLMKTMARECHRPSVKAVHSYEDCSLLQFEEARRLGKACIYDMPIGYYPAWQDTQARLARSYSEWIPSGGLPSLRYVRPEQKLREMEIADLVLVPCTFVEKTIRQFHPEKKIACAPYGVDAEFWNSPARKQSGGALRFIYAGQLSLRKGIPLLIEAWAKADLKNATLDLVGPWHLSDAARTRIPSNVTVYPACSREILRERYRAADVFVFPSFFEGFGLVLLEAMACGLPAIASDATAAPDVLDESSGQVIPTGDVDALVESLRWFSSNRDRLPELSASARNQANRCSWAEYRRCVSTAVASLA